MIKKVHIHDLEVGTFVHDFNCASSKENIYIDGGLITSNSMIQILEAWGIKEVYIDTDKGRDISRLKTDRKRKFDKYFNKNRSETLRPRANEVPTDIEMKAAEPIVKKTAAFIKSTMEDVKTGKSVKVEESYALASNIHDSIERNKDALQLLTRIREKDEYTLYHSVSVSSLVLGMCSYYRIPEQEALDLGVGALFHDIGKTFIRNAILNKPGKLSEKEFEYMKLHAEFSAKLLRDVKGLPEEAHEIALHHHERIDGTGYPFGLKESEIGFGTQLTSISDIFDAVTSDRCYRQGLGTIEGLRILYELSGKHLQKELTLDFIQNIGIYPIGSCVQVEGGLIGIVIGSTEDLEKPLVKVLYDKKKGKTVKNMTINLETANMSIISYIDPAKLKLTPRHILNIIKKKSVHD